MFAQKWFLYAALAAASAALVSIFGKVGMSEVNPIFGQLHVQCRDDGVPAPCCLAP